MRSIPGLITCCIIIIMSCPEKTMAQNGRAEKESEDHSVIVLPVRVDVPANARKVGTIKAGDNALSTTCDYEEVVRDAKEQAKILGGNIVKITELVSPVFISKCYRIKADVYYADTLPHYNIAVHKDTEATQSAAYALLYVYRLKDTLALEPAYDLHLNGDSVIYRVRSRSHTAIKIYDTGMITLWAETSERQDLTMNIKPGGVYYLRCALKHGELRLMPFMELRAPASGAYEYGKLNKEKKEKAGLEYLKEIH